MSFCYILNLKTYIQNLDYQSMDVKKFNLIIMWKDKPVLGELSTLSKNCIRRLYVVWYRTSPTAGFPKLFKLADHKKLKKNWRTIKYIQKILRTIK